MKLLGVSLWALVVAINLVAAEPEGEVVVAAPSEPVVAVVSPDAVTDELLAAASSVPSNPLVVVPAPSNIALRNVSAPAGINKTGANEDQATAAGGHFGGPEYAHHGGHGHPGGHHGGPGHHGGWGWGGWGWPKVVNYPPVHAHFKGHTSASHGPKYVKDYHYHKHAVLKHPHYEQVHHNHHKHQHLLHQHHEHQQVLHRHHYHQHLLHQHHLHREHLHNHHLHKHHLHQTHVHKLHIHQPVYHKSVKDTHSVSEGHKHKYHAQEYHKHTHPQKYEYQKWAPPVYAKGWGGAGY